MRKFRLLMALLAVYGILMGTPVWSAQKETVDVTVVASIAFNGSVRRHAVGLIESLQDSLNMNFVVARDLDFTDLPPSVAKFLRKPFKAPGNVAFLDDPLWFADAVPDCPIKIAFSVVEGTLIPLEWVAILNKKFDAVAVADPYLVKVYENSGVKIPVFHIPLGIYIEEFLEKPLKNAPGKPFVFGSSARLYKRKNQALLIRAFAAEFGNRDDVVLKLHTGGLRGTRTLLKELKSLIQELNVTNVHLTYKALSWTEYVEMMAGFDGYVNISTAEGYSITPRESLALGIPTIATDNTAQKSICASGWVRAVPCPIEVVSEDRGMQFTCEQKEVQAALRDVYEHYDQYLLKAHQGREWARQFLWSSLKKKYISFFKPKTLKLGTKNEVTDDYLMTNSKKLYNKYQKILQNNN